MDGFAAPDPDREPSEPAGIPSRRSDADQELHVLRARAYGPEPDIETDPTALARLIDLEAAHVTAQAAVPAARPGRASATARMEQTTDRRITFEPATPTAEPMSDVHPATLTGRSVRSLWRRAAATPGRTRLIVVSTVSIVVVIGLLAWLSGSRPDATLHPIYGETNSEVLEVLEYQGWSPDASTLRQFEPFYDVDVWSIENGVGYVCLVAWDRTSGRFATQCVPPRIELSLYVETTGGAPATDGFGERLPGGSFVSLHLRQGTVDVYVHDP